jgi:transposase
MGRRSDLPVDARMTAVLAVLKGEESLEAVARRHGISSQTLVRWKQEFLEAGRDRLRGKGIVASQREKELEAEVRKRDQLIGELVVANELLKKTPISR